MTTLLDLKHVFNLSDEERVARWPENVVWQCFSGQDYYTPKLPCDTTQIGRFRAAIGEAGVEELLKATIDTALQTKSVRPSEFERVIVDTTVQRIRSQAYGHDRRQPRGGQPDSKDSYLGHAAVRRIQVNLAGPT